MKKIPLTQGKEALVDDEDYADLMKYNWYATLSSNGRRWYARRRVRSLEREIYGPRTALRMHVYLMSPPPGMVVHHINNNPLDNRKENLKVMTQAENMAEAEGWIHKNSRKRGTPLDDLDF